MEAIHNLTGSIDLLKLEMAGLATIHGKRCVVIPIEGNDLYVTKDEITNKAKGIYLGLTIKERQQESQFGKTHYCKQSLSREFREQATEEMLKRKSETYLGDFKPWNFEGTNAVGSVLAPEVETQKEDDDLPF